MVPQSHIKCVVVGDGAVGKTCMLMSYTENKFPSDYVPTVFDNYSANVPVDGRMINVGFWDTAGQDDYEKLRPLSYRDANVIILSFSLVNRPSYENIPTKWIKELKEWVPQAPIILVGTMLDLRQSEAYIKDRPTNSVVTNSMGEQMKESIGAFKYVECSALTQESLKLVFDTAIIAALRGPVLTKPAKMPRKKNGMLSRFKSMFSRKK